MPHPPPPGANNLPARPPPPASGDGSSKGGFKPAFSSATPAAQPYARNVPTTPASYTGSNAPAIGPVAPPPQSHQYGPSSYPTYSAPGTVNAPPSQQPPRSSYQRSQPPYGAPQTYSGAPSYSQPATTYSAAPSIKNPFPVPGAAGASEQYDPEMAAQIAQWQSAYSAPPLGKDGKPIAATVELPKPEVPVANPNNKKKTVVREGGGKKWTDESLLEWDPSHLRLFVGNLAGETTDDSLLKAFTRWKSVQKARVIRDKRTNKSKGYGFVSFSDADDFFQSAKEMNGKYIQSHPVTVSKAVTEIKVSNVKEKDHRGRNNKNKNKNRNFNRGGNNNSGESSYEPNLGPAGGNAITKPGQKNKNGLRLLG